MGECVRGFGGLWDAKAQALPQSERGGKTGACKGPGLTREGR